MYTFVDWIYLFFLLLFIYEKIRINRHLDNIILQLEKIEMRVWKLEDLD